MRTILYLDDGWSYKQVAKALFLDISTIRRCYATYRESGMEVLLVVLKRACSSLLIIMADKIFNHPNMINKFLEKESFPYKSVLHISV